VVEKNSGGTTIFTENLTYDVFNNLIGVKVNGTQQRWTVFDGSNPYIDFNGSGSVTQRYLIDPTALDRFFATLPASGGVNWLLTDNLGSIREVISKTGTVLDQITYGAFGNILSQTNSSNAPRYLYAGGEWDGNLGLYHFGARWDDPVDGRWISQDPLSLGPDTNPYRYVGNEPTSFTDPNGLDRTPTAAGVYGYNPLPFDIGNGLALITNRTCWRDYIEGIPAGNTRRAIGGEGDLLRELREVPDNSLDTLVLSGHTSATGIGVLTRGGRLAFPDDLSPVALDLIRDKLRPNGRFVIAGCEVASGTEDTMRDLARRLDRAVVANDGSVWRGAAQNTGHWVTALPDGTITRERRLP
jgi:RHS repeat-associated protein